MAESQGVYATPPRPGGGEETSVTEHVPELPLVGDTSVPSSGQAGTPTVLSSASDTGSIPTKRGISRMKARLVHMSEHLRENLKKVKKGLEKESHERKQEAPTLHQLVDSRMEMLTSAFHVGINALRDEMMSLITPLQVDNTTIKSTLMIVEECAQIAAAAAAEAADAAAGVEECQRAHAKEDSPHGSTD